MRHRVPFLAFIALVSFAVPAAGQAGAPLVGLKADVSANYVFLSWTGTEQDEGHAAELIALGGYSVLGALSPGGAVIGSIQIPVLPPEPERPFQPSTVIPGVPDGTFWIIAVKGLTTVTNAPASAWVQIVVNVNNCGFAPAAPTSLQNLPTPGKPVALSWTWNSAPTGCLPTHFLVAAGTSPGLSNVGVVEISGVVTVLQGTAPEGTYYVRVHARNQFGISAPSNEVQLTVTGCAGPGPPQNLVATVVGNKQLQLSWSPPSGDLTNLTGYRLIGRIVGNPLFGGMVDVGPMTSLLTGPIPSNTYEIQVQAISVCQGSSPQLSAPSLPFTVTVP